MGYIVEYRNEEHEELVEKLKKAKKAVCEAWEAVEKQSQDEYKMQHRGGRYRSGGHYRGGMDDDMESTGRYMGRYDY